MFGFIVTTDSGCDLLYSLLRERNVIPIWIQYAIDGKVMDDTMRHEDCKKFYDSMRAGRVPTTSQINIMQFMEFWRQLTERKLPIVHICLGSHISGTYSNGLAAMKYLKEQLPEAKIYPIDSTLASVGYGSLRLLPPICATAGSLLKNVWTG